MLIFYFLDYSSIENVKEQFPTQKQQKEGVKVGTDKKFEVNKSKVTEQEIDQNIKENSQGFLLV